MSMEEPEVEPQKYISQPGAVAQFVTFSSTLPRGTYMSSKEGQKYLSLQAFDQFKPPETFEPVWTLERYSNTTFFIKSTGKNSNFYVGVEWQKDCYMLTMVSKKAEAAIFKMTQVVIDNKNTKYFNLIYQRKWYNRYYYLISKEDYSLKMVRYSVEEETPKYAHWRISTVQSSSIKALAGLLGPQHPHELDFFRQLAQIKELRIFLNKAEYIEIGDAQFLDPVCCHLILDCLPSEVKSYIEMFGSFKKETFIPCKVYERIDFRDQAQIQIVESALESLFIAATLRKKERNKFPKDSFEYLHFEYLRKLIAKIYLNLKDNVEASKRSKKLMVLSLDGGGIRGLISALILQQLEKDLNKQAWEMFDLMVGTSTGGIIALGLSVGISAKDLVELYTTRGKDIFDKKGRGGQCKHSAEGLKMLLKGKLGDLKLKDAKKKVGVTTCANFQDDQNYSEGFVFTNLLEEHKEISMVDAALCTSAAPTYFPYHNFSYNGHIRSFIDGGVICNNPSLVGQSLAHRMLKNAKVQEIFQLSISTGLPHQEIVEKNTQPLQLTGDESLDLTGGSWNPRWALHGLFFSMAGSATLSDKLMEIQKGGSLDYIRLKPVDVDQIDLDACDEESLKKLQKAAQDLIESKEYQTLKEVLKNQLTNPDKNSQKPQIVVEKKVISKTKRNDELKEYPKL